MIIISFVTNNFKWTWKLFLSPMKWRKVDSTIVEYG